jgi:hypothetical protein
LTAVALGWSRERALVIDEDQAHTATSCRRLYAYQSPEAPGLLRESSNPRAPRIRKDGGGVGQTAS